MSNLFFLLPSLAWLFSIIGTAALLPLLRKRVMDNPNERSNHKAPTPRGGGIAMIGVTLACFTYIGIAPSIIAAGLLLAVVSFADDMRGMPVSVRFLTQFVAVALAISALPGRILPDEIPIGVEYALIAFAWLWFINLTNFMDGIDGISAMQTIMMMVGIIVIYEFFWHIQTGGGPTDPNDTSLFASLLRTSLPKWLPLCAGVIAGAALGFLRFNISPARLFMGDVGSIPLGFLNGFLLLSLATYGHWKAALLLPAYYLSDATLTLFKRALRGEKVWQAHSQHAYQQAVRRGLSHNQVVLRISVLNFLLILLALYPAATMMQAILTCVVGYTAALILVCHLSHAPVSQKPPAH